MSDKYIVGVDLRTMEEATVIIASKNLPDREILSQMTARGVRTMGEMVTHLFVQGDEENHHAYLTHLKDTTGTDY